MNVRNVNSLNTGQRVVIKVGSTLLVDRKRGVVHREWLKALAGDIAELRGRGQEVLVVSSGAIALGRRQLGFSSGNLKLEEKQAAAASGMIRLAHAYQESLAEHDLATALVLLTIGDTENRRRYLNARNTIDQLLRSGAIPVINENDTVATDEIRIGDNDRLAARVAAMISADILVVLSDVDGLYTADPRLQDGAQHIPEVKEITPEIESMAGVAKPDDGLGGMITKLEAAKISIGAGCRMVILNGHVKNPLKALEQGAPCTWFMPSTSPRTERKQWIAGSLKPSGKLVVDDGALAALKQGKSLLPAGVTDVEGMFERGDAVAICARNGQEVARGLCAYSAADARQIKGYKSGEIERLLGYRGRDEMVHRDDMVLS
ncbi:MAG: glutamate 5-kinase [Rhodospirillales bacterium]|jgi:glutamate 5-kinase